MYHQPLYFSHGGRRLLERSHLLLGSRQPNPTRTLDAFVNVWQILLSMYSSVIFWISNDVSLKFQLFFFSTGFFISRVFGCVHCRLHSGRPIDLERVKCRCDSFQFANERKRKTLRINNKDYLSEMTSNT